MRYLLVVLAYVAQPTMAAAPDFYVQFDKCSSTVGYHVMADDALKTFEGTGLTMTCSRAGKAIKCALDFAGQAPGANSKTIDYQVDLDSPPTLLFSDQDGADWIRVDTVKHAAVLISRIVGDQYSGAKVCHGFFATASEVEAISKSKP